MMCQKLIIDTIIETSMDLYIISEHIPLLRIPLDI